MGIMSGANEPERRMSVTKSDACCKVSFYLMKSHTNLLQLQQSGNNPSDVISVLEI